MDMNYNTIDKHITEYTLPYFAELRFVLFVFYQLCLQPLAFPLCFYFSLKGSNVIGGFFRLYFSL